MAVYCVIITVKKVDNTYSNAGIMHTCRHSKLSGIVVILGGVCMKTKLCVYANHAKCAFCAI